jgi:hypothetical protein
MKRIATVAVILTAFAAVPSVAAAKSSPALAKPQLTAQVVRVQTARVQRAQVALAPQRHLVQIAHPYRLALLGMARSR